MEKTQKGATIWVNLIWILMGVVIAIAAVKLIPLYLDNYNVIGSLDGLRDQQDFTKLKDKDIHKILQKHFTINSVRSIGKDQIIIERAKKTKELVAVNIDYEVREHLFYNIDVILSFNNRLDPREAE